ncbi:MAG: ATP-binding cassette domain-containing protein [Spirochaeta sp.]|nr:ATP-binding cassette domain-containing protein [Spirochaeta sp.]
MAETTLLEIQNLAKYFEVGRSLFKKKRHLYAVDGISVYVRTGETLALVGESGCGKSTTGRLILNLEQPTGGHIFYRGKDLADYTAKDWKRYRQGVQVVFQDSHSSLNPRKTIRHILTAAMFSSGTIPRKDSQAAEERARALMAEVGLKPAETFLAKYPNELSGGQRQRIGIARALSTNPDLIVADEPVSSLDVSVKAQVLNLLDTLQKEKGVAYLFISHELSIVRSIADRVAVMYLGKIVESGPVADVFDAKVHPYTEALISATPIPDPDTTRNKKRIVLPGGVPSPMDPPKGCPFHPRCFRAEAKCATEVPPTVEVAPGHHAACHFAEERFAAFSGSSESIRTVKSRLCSQ